LVCSRIPLEAMLIKLLSLYKKETKAGRTPLEDFVTEVFAEILRKNQVLLHEFTKFLHLPEDDYCVLTQEKYPFDEKPCIIDLVLLGKKSNTICFFESKVNSLEGKDQLNRYSSLLLRKLSEPGKEAGKGILVFCTKYPAEKQCPPEFVGNSSTSFIQIRWHDIYDLLTKYSQVTYVSDFLALLKLKKMSQRLVITEKDLDVLRSLQDTIGLLKEYLTNSREDFIRAFDPDMKRPFDGLTVSAILEQNKVFYRYSNVLGGPAWSDLKYGFDFDNSTIFVNVWVDNGHPLLNATETRAKTLLLNIRQIGEGTEVYLERELSDLTGSANALNIVKEWFNTSFRRFSELLVKPTANDE
jgi:hypothetical protein